VNNVEAFRDLDAHAALKQMLLESGICCETVEMDATPVVKALLNVAEAVLGAGARKVLVAALREIRTIPVKVPQSLAFDSMEEEDFALFFYRHRCVDRPAPRARHIGRRARGLLADGQRPRPTG